MGPYTPPVKNVRPPAPRLRQLPISLPAPDGTCSPRYILLAHVAFDRTLQKFNVS